MKTPTPTRATCCAVALVAIACSPSNEASDAARSALRVSDSCPERRFIGVRSGASCPTPGPGWHLGTPFGSPYASGPLPASLAAFCQYDWQGAGAPQVDLLPADGRRGPSDWLDPDCQVVAPLDPVLGDVLTPSLADAFLRQVEVTDGLPMQSGHGVRATLVSVVDTTPGLPGDGRARVGRSLHGYTVARIIRAIACPDPTAECLGYVDMPLGLPRLGASREDPVSGGYFGSQGDLAAAVFDAVARVDDQGALPVRHQIINLSVGWSPRWGGVAPDTSRATGPVRAVYEALRYARCEGALIVAAAGNAEGGGGGIENGLMFPAAWADLPVTCDGAAFDDLLVAAGGVNHADDFLGNGRPLGWPRLVAPADHAVVPGDATSSGFTPTLSGTSASAAVVSGVAAMVWGYRTELTADQVADLLYDSAVDLQRSADVCGAATCGVRRVSACRALRAACDGTSNGPCPERVPRCPRSTEDDGPQEVFEGEPVVARAEGEFTDVRPFDAPDRGQIPECGARAFVVDPAPEQVCPLAMTSAWVARPYAGPLPSVPVCPHCFAYRSPQAWTGYFGVNPDLLGVAVKVRLNVAVGGELYVFEVGPETWKPGRAFKVPGIPVPEGDVSKVVLTYVVADESGESYTGVEPLLVY